MGEIYRPESKISGRGVKSLAAGGFERIDVVGQRRFFAVSNCEASGGRILYVAGSDQVPALAVFPQTMTPIAADSEFYVINRTGSGGTIAYVVGEIIAQDLGGPPTAKVQQPAGGSGPAGGNPYGGPGFGRGGGGLSFPP